MGSDLLACDDRGLACAPGGFHIDPWKPVPIAVITHAHADHARPGSGIYYCSASCKPLLQRRVQPGADIRGIEFGHPLSLGGVSISFHPAGHVLGSAQVRVERDDEVWVVSGDYKRQHDPTCEPFEPLACDVFITEATFGLPIYTWDPTEQVMSQIIEWWRQNAQAGRASVLCAYSLGKAQRILGELYRHAQQEAHAWMADTPVLVHGAMIPLIEAYRTQGIPMLKTIPATAPAERDPASTKPPRSRAAESHEGRLILAPPSAVGSSWMRRFDRGAGASTASASGWMRLRGIRRRQGYDAGFVISDHADWHDLIRTVRQTGARRVLVTHGQTVLFSRYLRDIGIDASPLETPYNAGADDDISPSEAPGVEAHA